MRNKKLIAAVCCMALLVGAVGATLAWLAAQTNTVTNTFAPSTIDITLTESETTDGDNDGNVDRNYEMVPGYTLDKDPKVTVLPNSEACYLFVTVEEVGGNVTVTDADGTARQCSFDDFIDYSVITATGEWNLLEDAETGKEVYYRIVPESAAAQSFDIIQTTISNEVVRNKVSVKSDVTKEMMDALKDANPNQDPQLVFQAYATQLYKTNPETEVNQFTPSEAWNNAKGSN